MQQTETRAAACPMDARRLALEVLRQAMLDATGDDSLPRKGQGLTVGARGRAIAEARAFWQAETGEWAQARRIWCDVAGVDPDYARAQALRRIAAHRGLDPRERRKGEIAARNNKIRALRAQGRTAQQLAGDFGLAVSVVFEIVAGRR